MKTWDIDDKVDAAYEMRMQQVNHTIRTGGAAAGALTVRDYFAAKAMDVYLTATMGQLVDCRNVSESAYQMADAMMRERERKQPEPCSVEEAFGL